MTTTNNLHADEPPSGYSPLEKIISEQYVDYAEIIATVRKHSFEATLYPVLKKVDDYIKANNYESIPNIIGTLLTTINDKLAEVSGREKEILEELTSELFKEQLTVLNSTKEGQLCWQKCLPVLKETCEFKAYNFELLAELLGLNFIKKSRSNDQFTRINLTPLNPKMLSISKQDENNLYVAKSIERELPYYLWIGPEGKDLKLIRALKDKEWIRNIPEFKKLFKSISDPNYSFCASSENKEKLLVLFAELKREQLIRPKTNRGHFYPLGRYGSDLGKRLFEKEPKRYLENLKRRKGEYNSVLAEVQKIIRLNCGKNPDL
nr:hypothetical protein [uncultured Fluviicola sp.]